MTTKKRQTKQPGRAADDDDDDPAGKAGKEKRELQKRVMTGWEAMKCCVKGRNDASRFVTEATDNIRQAFEDPKPPAQAGPPIPSQVYTWLAWMIAGTRTGQKMIPMVWNPVTNEWQQDGQGFALPINDGEMDRLEETQRELAYRLRDRSSEVCAKCVREKVLGQDKKRQWVNPAPPRKGPRTRDSLLLRVPHQ